MAGRPPHVGGKRTGNHDAISSVEKSSKEQKVKSKGGVAHTYFGNSHSCNTEK